MYCITGMNTEDAGCRHTNGTFKVQTTRRSYIPAPGAIRRSLLKIVPITGFQRWDPVLEIYFCPSPGSCEFLQINQLILRTIIPWAKPRSLHALARVTTYMSGWPCPWVLEQRDAPSIAPIDREFSRCANLTLGVSIINLRVVRVDCFMSWLRRDVYMNTHGTLQFLGGRTERTGGHTMPEWA